MNHKFLINKLEEFIEKYSKYGSDTPISLAYINNGCMPYSYALAKNLIHIYKKVYVLHIADYHCVTLVNKLCIDITIGAVFDKHPQKVITQNLKPTYKLSNFIQKEFDKYWTDSVYTNKKLTFEAFKITSMGFKRHYA